MVVSRLKERDPTHDLIVAEVAKQEFRYPSREHPNWRTISNKPNPTLALPLKPNPVFPDVVIIDNEKVIQMICEVETEKTVNEEQNEKWKAYSDYCLGDLYLYVPEIRVTLARELLNSNHIAYARVTQYSFFYGEVKFKKI